MRSLWFIFVIGLSLSHQIHNIAYNYHWYVTHNDLTAMLFRMYNMEKLAWN